MRPLMCMYVSTLSEGVLPLSNSLEICLQKGFILCNSLRAFFWSSVKGGGIFTLSVVDVVVGSVSSVVLVGLHVLLWVWVAGPSGVDVTNMFIEVMGVVGVSLTSTNHERQSAALVWVHDIHSNVMLQVAISRDHLFTLLLAFLPFKNFCRALWSLWTTMSDPCR